MCQATVFLRRGEQKEEVTRDVILLQEVEGGVRIQSFFDAPVTLRARVREIDFLKHNVTLEPLEQEE
ncbi:MAG: CooT family nickel-binding protein [Chloroflexi bacterium]|nr:CooT family nickel-binding protein [Chloroflexota bacterium]